MKTGFEPQDVHHLVDGLASGRGVVLALPHMGNYDLAGAWVTTKLDTPFTTVAERLKPETLYDRFVAYRESLGMEVLPHTGGSAFGTLARRLRDGGLVCLVADRDLSASGVEVKFFGDTARMPMRPRPAGPADGRAAAARDALVRRVARHAGPGAPADRGARDGHARGEDLRDDPGAGGRLRHRNCRTPGGLAHAAATVARRP